MILSGRSTQDVADALNAEKSLPPKGKSWKSSEVRRHLKKESLKGVMEWAGIPTICPAILEPAEWGRVQKVLDTTSLPRGKDRNHDVWPLSQRVSCSCGGYLIARGRTRGIRYYRCSNHQGDRKGLCKCDHDQSPRRPRWIRADDLERSAWEQCVLILNDKELLHAAINHFLGRAIDGSVDPEAHRKVKANVVALRAAVVEAQADFYAGDKEERVLMGKTVTSLIERLRTAVAEQNRIEGAMSDYQKAELQAETWLKTSEDYGIQLGVEPDTETLLRLFTELDVTGSMRSQDEVDALVERYAEKDWENGRITIPFVPWLNVTALSIDPLQLIR